MLLGTFWVRNETTLLYQVVAQGDFLEMGRNVVPGVTLDRHDTLGSCLMLSEAQLRMDFSSAVDPRGFWPFLPSRWAIESLQGRHGARGVLGHHALYNEFGWRSVDERAVDLNIPTMKALMWSIGSHMRRLWKLEFQTDPIMFNVPKTRVGSGNHQKCMYPPGLFWVLDDRLREHYDLILRAVARVVWPVDVSSLSQSEVEHYWSSIDPEQHDAPPKDFQTSQLYSADSKRIHEWVARTRESATPGVVEPSWVAASRDAEKESLDAFLVALRAQI